MKRLLTTLTLTVFLLSGIWLLSSGSWIYAKAELAQLLLETAWFRTRQGEKEVKPWPWADTWPIARLDVPRLGVSRFVLAGASGSSLAFGPGHLFGSASPGGNGNSVIAGHRDTHFAFLQDLEPGDRLEIEGPDTHVHRYRVTTSSVVDAGDSSVMLDKGIKQLSLVTCYPFGDLRPGGNLRFVLIAEAETATASAN